MKDELWTDARWPHESTIFPRGKGPVVDCSVPRCKSLFSSQPHHGVVTQPLLRSA
jgi:hypothetical protein